MTRDEWQYARRMWDEATEQFIQTEARKPNRPRTMILTGHAWSCRADDCPYRRGTGPCPTTGEPSFTYPGDLAEVMEQAG